MHTYTDLVNDDTLYEDYVVNLNVVRYVDSSINLLSEEERGMLEIKDCGYSEEAKKLIREYSEIKGAESCFVSLDKELVDLE